MFSVASVHDIINARNKETKSTHAGNVEITHESTHVQFSHLVRNTVKQSTCPNGRTGMILKLQGHISFRQTTTRCSSCQQRTVQKTYRTELQICMATTIRPSSCHIPILNIKLFNAITIYFKIYLNEFI